MKKKPKFHPLEKKEVCGKNEKAPKKSRRETSRVAKMRKKPKFHPCRKKEACGKSEKVLKKPH